MFLDTRRGRSLSVINSHGTNQMTGPSLSIPRQFIPVLVTILCLVPFLNKAFTIDDPMFIWTAKHIQRNPANFYGFEVHAYGTTQPMTAVQFNPPANCYFIALVGALFGYSEVALHTAFLVPAAMAAMGMYYLAKRFCSRPVLAALAAVLTPGFLVPATSVMGDVMMAALWIWAVVFWVGGIKENDRWQLFFAAVLAGACVLTKFNGIAAPALMLVYSLGQKRKPAGWFFFLLIPVLALAGYHLVTSALYGRGLFLNAANFGTQVQLPGIKELFSRGLKGLAFTGGCAASALFLAPFVWSWQALARGAVLAVLILAIAFGQKADAGSIPGSGGARLIFLAQVSVLAMTGLSLLWLAFADFWKCRDSDSFLLLLWVVGTFIFASFISWTVNVRYLLPLVAPAGILLIRQIERRRGTCPAGWGRKEAWALVPAACLAIIVCGADFSWAASARQAAEVICKKYGDHNDRMWFMGHWGFQYYMQNHGIRPVDLKNPRMLPGDTVVIPENNCFTGGLPEQMLRETEVLQFPVFPWLATMNPSAGAGFYLGLTGDLPFAAGRVEPERYYVCAVN